jgi:hypothetical protein
VVKSAPLFQRTPTRPVHVSSPPRGDHRKRALVDLSSHGFFVRAPERRDDLWPGPAPRGVRISLGGTGSKRRRSRSDGLRRRVSVEMAWSGGARSGHPARAACRLGPDTGDVSDGLSLDSVVASIVRWLLRTRHGRQPHGGCPRDEADLAPRAPPSARTAA